MKAFVIKNKEGKYFHKGLTWFYHPKSKEGRWDEEHYYYGDKDSAEDSIRFYKLKDCSIIPITIAEGDLEEENRVLKSKLYEIWYNFVTMGEICVTESKKEISSENAVEEIRNYLSNIDLCFDEIKEKLGVDYFIKQTKGE